MSVELPSYGKNPENQSDAKAKILSMTVDSLDSFRGKLVFDYKFEGFAIDGLSQEQKIKTLRRIFAKSDTSFKERLSGILDDLCKLLENGDYKKYNITKYEILFWLNEDLILNNVSFLNKKGISKMKFLNIKRDIDMVKGIQKILASNLVYFDRIDGIYGKNTMKGAIALQNIMKDQMLYKSAVDGLIGKNSFRSLQSLLDNFISKGEEEIDNLEESNLGESDDFFSGIPENLKNEILDNHHKLEENSFDKRIGRNVDEFMKKFPYKKGTIRSGIISSILDSLIRLEDENINKIYKEIFGKEYLKKDWDKIATNGTWEKSKRKVSILYNYIKILPYETLDIIGVPQDTFWMLGSKKEIMLRMGREGSLIDKDKLGNKWTKHDIDDFRKHISKLDSISNIKFKRYFDVNFSAKDFPHLGAVTQCVDSMMGIYALYAYENQLDFAIAKSNGFVKMSDYDSLEQFLYDVFIELHTSYMKNGMAGLFEEIGINEVREGDIIYIKHKNSGGHVMIARGPMFYKGGNDSYSDYGGIFEDTKETSYIPTFSGNQINNDWINDNGWRKRVSDQYAPGFANHASRKYYSGFGIQVVKGTFDYYNAVGDSDNGFQGIEKYVKFWRLSLKALNGVIK